MSGKLPLVRANILTEKASRNQSFSALRYKRAAGREQTEAQERCHWPLIYLQANLAAALCLHASLGSILYPSKQTLSFFGRTTTFIQQIFAGGRRFHSPGGRETSQTRFCKHSVSSSR